MKIFLSLSLLSRFSLFEFSFPSSSLLPPWKINGFKRHANILLLYRTLQPCTVPKLKNMKRVYLYKKKLNRIFFYLGTSFLLTNNYQNNSRVFNSNYLYQCCWFPFFRPKILLLVTSHIQNLKAVVWHFSCNSTWGKCGSCDCDETRLQVHRTSSFKRRIFCFSATAVVSSFLPLPHKLIWI